MGADDDLLNTRNELDLELEEVTVSSGSDTVVTEGELERYGVWVKVEPETIDETFPDLDIEAHLEDLDTGIADLPPLDETIASDLTEEEEELLGNLETQTDTEGDLAELGDFDVPVDDDLYTSTDDHVEVPLSDDAETFDDLSALEEELTMAVESGTPPAATIEQPDILRKIEEELAAIKGELTQLKRELATMRAPGAKSIAVAPVLSADETETGFFADDGDETIALTGDELDNILNTAEITEEELAEGLVAPDEMSLESLDSGLDDDLTLDLAGPGDIDLDALEVSAPEGEDELDELTLDESDDEVTLEEVPEEFGVEEIDLDADLGIGEISFDNDLVDLSAVEGLEAEDTLGELSLDIDESSLDELSLEEDSVDDLEELSLYIEDETADDVTLDLDAGSVDELSLDIETEVDELSLDIEEPPEAELASLDEFSLEVAEQADEEPALDLEDETVSFVDELEELSLDIDETPDVDLEIEEEPLEDLSLELDESSLELSLEDDAAEDATESLDELALDIDEPFEDLEPLQEEPVDLDLDIPTLDELDELDFEIDVDMDAANELAKLTEIAPTESPGQVVPVDEVIEEISFELDDEIEALEDELSLEIPEDDTLVDMGGPGEDEELETLEELSEESFIPEAEEISLELPPEEEPAEAALALDIPEIATDALDLEDIDIAPVAVTPTFDEEPAPAPVVSGEVMADQIPTGLQSEIRSVLKYMDQLLENLPDEKIEEFARSEYFEVYKRLFEELEIVS